MRKLAVTALIGLLAASILPGPPAHAVECIFVAPYEAASERDTPQDDDDRDSARDRDDTRDRRSGSVGPTFRDRDDAEETRSRRPPQGGPSTKMESLQAGRQPRLDVDAFVGGLDRKLRQSASGHVLQLRKDGRPLHTKSHQWARRPGDGGLAWTADQPMHVASISKLVTAVGLVRLLDDKGISVQAKIADYLPAHWAKGPNIDRITFAQLMRHETGFATGTYYSDYRFMQRQVANGVSDTGTYTYQNINFGLARVLIPIINGDIRKDAKLDDEAWDDRTLEAYDAFMQRTVFAPAGVTGATLARPAAAALAYTFPPGERGWDSGKLACIAGTAALYMSVNDLLDVLGTLRRGGTILAADRAQVLLEQSFGIDRIEQAGAGALYIKSGRWWRGEKPSRPMEQSVAAFLPDGMELAIFVNSPIGRADEYLPNLVVELYHRHVRY